MINHYLIHDIAAARRAQLLAGRPAKRIFQLPARRPARAEGRP